MLENIYKKKSVSYMDEKNAKLEEAKDRFKSFRDLFKHRICPEGFSEKLNEFYVKTNEFFIVCRLDYDRIPCVVIPRKEVSIEINDLKAIYVDCSTSFEVVSMESSGGVVRIAYSM